MFGDQPVDEAVQVVFTYTTCVCCLVCMYLCHLQQLFLFLALVLRVQAFTTLLYPLCMG